MADQTLSYALLVQDALRSVIKKILADVAKHGLPHNHHFFITFSTEHSGVKISSNLKKRYPHSMTIVLQHQFWDLKVYDNRFEVTLAFSGKSEALTIPFHSITIFLDPIAAFRLDFDPVEASNKNFPFWTYSLATPYNKGNNNKRHNESLKLLDPNFANKNALTLNFPKEGDKTAPNLSLAKNGQKQNNEKLGPKATTRCEDNKPVLNKPDFSNKDKDSKAIAPNPSKAMDKAIDNVVSLEAFRKNKE